MADEVPGLTFHIKDRKLEPCPGSKFKATGSVTIRAEIGDLDVWDSVLDRLDGMTVHTTHDVAGALVAAAKHRTKKAEETAMKITEESRKEIDKLEARSSFLEQDNDNLRRQLETLQANYEALDEYVKAKEG